MATAQSLIDRAKGLALPFLGQNSAAPGPLLHSISALDEEAFNLGVQTAPELLMTEAATPITVGSTAAAHITGYNLEAGARGYADFVYITADESVYPLSIIPHAHRDDPTQHPAATLDLVNSKLHPCDPNGSRWESGITSSWWIGNGDTVTYRVVPAKTPITSFSGTLQAPELALDWMAWSLALQLMLNFHTHEGVVPQARMEMALAMSQTARANMLLAMSRAAPVSSNVRGRTTAFYTP